MTKAFLPEMDYRNTCRCKPKIYNDVRFIAVNDEDVLHVNVVSLKSYVTGKISGYSVHGVLPYLGGSTSMLSVGLHEERTLKMVGVAAW